VVNSFPVRCRPSQGLQWCNGFASWSVGIVGRTRDGYRNQSRGWPTPSAEYNSSRPIAPDSRCMPIVPDPRCSPIVPDPRCSPIVPDPRFRSLSVVRSRS
jgi:hypothetical protein